jgi:hypothetical protein
MRFALEVAVENQVRKKLVKIVTIARSGKMRVVGREGC